MLLTVLNASYDREGGIAAYFEVPRGRSLILGTIIHKSPGNVVLLTVDESTHEIWLDSGTL